ncbi:hypothetical protein POL25_23660 [Nannocystis sp. bb15-2]|uniref:DUF3990 domain-containing protein n=1 Tax=Nannocystis bainbridge TaxID=2995303 RepID=A0ABT5E217_9BACT|nr:hypothetical protein [Nannocystis bainbridge]
MVGFHGTRGETAARLVDGTAVGKSENDDDWLGHGIYFWEYAPQQAWRWARQRHGKEAAVVGALIRLGRCFDLLDPENVPVLQAAHADFVLAMRATGAPLPENVKKNKRLDCAVFNYFCGKMVQDGQDFESIRAAFVPGSSSAGGLERAWKGSGIFKNAHIQLCVRRAPNIVAIWSMKRDGRYGRDEDPGFETESG